MQVVNVKVKYIRPKYKNLKCWMEDKNNVYIGRKNIVFIDGKRYPPNNSEFANPFKINKNMTRDTILDKYEIYIKNKIKNDENLKKKLMRLKNKNLGCWCKPEKCHGDILINIINELTNSN